MSTVFPPLSKDEKQQCNDALDAIQKRAEQVKPSTTADILENAANTFRERNKIYGNNYERLGNTLAAMFPEGVTAKTAHDWIRLYFLLLTQVKLSRYVTNWNNGGHKDSIHDTVVYAAMLEMIDAQKPIG